LGVNRNEEEENSLPTFSVCFLPVLFGLFAVAHVFTTIEHQSVQLKKNNNKILRDKFQWTVVYFNRISDIESK
jgi:hypothetical protein